MRNNNIKIAKELVKIAKPCTLECVPKLELRLELSKPKSFSDFMSIEFSEIADEVGTHMTYCIPVGYYLGLDSSDFCTFSNFFNSFYTKAETNNKFFKTLKRFKDLLSSSKFIVYEDHYFQHENMNRNLFIVDVEASANVIKKGMRIRDKELKKGYNLHYACMQGYEYMQKIFYDEIEKIKNKLKNIK